MKKKRMHKQVQVNCAIQFKQKSSFVHFRVGFSKNKSLQVFFSKQVLLFITRNILGARLASL